MRRAIAGGLFLHTAEEMVKFLKNKFGAHENPTYLPKEIMESDFDKLSLDSRKTTVTTVDGSGKFQVIVFRPNSNKISSYK